MPKNSAEHLFNACHTIDIYHVPYLVLYYRV